MRLFRRAAVLLLVSAAWLPMFARPVVGAPIPKSELVKLKVAKHLDGPFRSCIAVHLVVGEHENVYAKAKSISGQDEPAVFDGVLVSPMGLLVKYFTENGTDITDAVNNPSAPYGYPFVAHDDHSKRFRVRLKQTLDGAQSPLSLGASDREDAASFAYVQINREPGICNL